MLSWYKVAQGVGAFFEKHYTGLWCLAVSFFICSGLVTCARTNDWQLDSLLRNIFYGPKHNTLHLNLMQAYLALFKIWFIEAFLIFNLIDWLESSDALYFKRRYREFIVKKLFLEVSRVDEEYLQKFRNNMTNIKSADYLEAHRRMQHALNEFRGECRKLYAPTHLELLMPCEEVFGILHEEEELINRSKFQNLPLKIDDKLIKSLLE